MFRAAILPCFVDTNMFWCELQSFGKFLKGGSLPIIRGGGAELNSDVFFQKSLIGDKTLNNFKIIYIVNTVPWACAICQWPMLTSRCLAIARGKVARSPPQNTPGTLVRMYWSRETQARDRWSPYYELLHECNTAAQDFTSQKSLYTWYYLLTHPYMTYGCVMIITQYKSCTKLKIVAAKYPDVV